MSRAFRLAGLTMVVTIAGCGGGGEGERIPLQGVVFSDNSPLAGASVAFVGNGGGVLASATTDAKGEFKLRAAPGKNKVAVSKVDTSKPPPTNVNADQSMPTEAEYQKMVKALPKPLVAERFADPEKSGIVVDVIKGIPSVDIKVSSK